MSKTLAELLEAAHSVVPRISTDDAQAKMAQGALLLDIRDAPELLKSGRAHGSHHIPRGMLEFRAQEGTPMHDPELRKDREIILHCAAGGRAALAGKVLKEMGYEHVFNLGGLNDWIQAGGPADEPTDKGM